MSSIFYRYNSKLSYIDNSTKQIVIHNIIDGSEGLSFLYIMKNGNETYKINVKENKNNTFKVDEDINNKVTTKNITYDELLNILRNNSKLSFVEDYINKRSKKSSSVKAIKSEKHEKPEKHEKHEKPEKAKSKKSDIKHEKTEKSDKKAKSKKS